MHRAGAVRERRGGRCKKRLAARVRWDYDVGWDYIDSIRRSGREVDPDDLPPALDWERDAWDLYQRVRTQWRVGLNGRSGLDYYPAIRLIEDWGWDLDRALEMLQAIELTYLCEDERRRERRERHPDQHIGRRR